MKRLSKRLAPLSVAAALCLNLGALGPIAAQAAMPKIAPEQSAPAMPGAPASPQDALGKLQPGSQSMPEMQKPEIESGLKDDLVKKKEALDKKRDQLDKGRQQLQQMKDKLGKAPEAPAMPEAPAAPAPADVIPTPPAQ